MKDTRIDSFLLPCDGSSKFYISKMSRFCHLVADEVKTLLVDREKGDMTGDWTYKLDLPVTRREESTSNIDHTIYEWINLEL